MSKDVDYAQTMIHGAHFFWFLLFKSLTKTGNILSFIFASFNSLPCGWRSRLGPINLMSCFFSCSSRSFYCDSSKATKRIMRFESRKRENYNPYQPGTITPWRHVHYYSSTPRRIGLTDSARVNLLRLPFRLPPAFRFPIPMLDNALIVPKLLNQPIRDDTIVVVPLLVRDVVKIESDGLDAAATGTSI